LDLARDLSVTHETPFLVTSSGMTPIFTQSAPRCLPRQLASLASLIVLGPNETPHGAREPIRYTNFTRERSLQFRQWLHFDVRQKLRPFRKSLNHLGRRGRANDRERGIHEINLGDL
jgi:hypothetical protein